MDTVTRSAGSGQAQASAAAEQQRKEEARREAFYRTELYNPWTWGQPAPRRSSETAQGAPSWDKEL